MEVITIWKMVVAPMMDWTDHHYRTLARLISKHAWLYTEMLAAETIVYQKGNLDRFLAYSPDQHPIVLQIGGSNLDNLAKATELANAYCYDEINFNCGCPSPRVAGRGCFGVRLMLDPKDICIEFIPGEEGCTIQRSRHAPSLSYRAYSAVQRLLTLAVELIPA
ncbi:hypothetical protein JHK85_028044 [Glycine max]|nr:hypothetical protein JHK85_028044 [Glycine max]